MAVYKIFPVADATIYSDHPAKNTGLDEILEVSLNKDITTGLNHVTRALIKFSPDEISSVFSNLVQGSNYSASLRMFLADSSHIPIEYTLYCFPTSDFWSMGTGRAANFPESTDGVSWVYTQNSDTTVYWRTFSFLGGETGSYATYATGGGTWWVGYPSSQTFEYTDNKDINFNVTPAISASFFGGVFENTGFIVKHADTLEFTSQSIALKYFSGDTHTIYPPCLEIKWDDFVYNTGSLGVISTDRAVVITKMKSEYQQDSVQTIRVNVREQYPARTFQTSSIYLDNKYLPTASYYAIKDIDTEEYVIDFDEQFTKISADGNGNYFKIFMNGLQPERWMKLLIKTTINGSTLVIDENNAFKVIR